jgi:hypothetical protein
VERSAPTEIAVQRRGSVMSNRFLNIKQSPEQLQQLGPSLCIEIELADGPQDQIPERFGGVVALVDTGANVSFISSRLITTLNATPVDTRIKIVNGKPENVAMYRCKVIYPNGVYHINDFSIFPNLSEPHDLLIGRDMLANTQMTVDFPSGNWTILFNVAHDNDSA